LKNKQQLNISNRIEVPFYADDVAVDILDNTKCLIVGGDEANLFDLEKGTISRKLFLDEDKKKLNQR